MSRGTWPWSGLFKGQRQLESAPASTRRPLRTWRPKPPRAESLEIRFDPARQSRSFLESAPVERRLTSAATWIYQLQQMNVAEIAASPADVAVIDSYADGMERFFTPAELEQMKKKRDGSRRRVIAYMSIGEAEEGRFYWKPAWIKKSSQGVKLAATAPKWLDGQNDGGWLDNFKVKYWMADWQQIICGDGGFMNRIIDAGFDGVYLDIIDAFEYYTDRGRKTAADEMVQFVIRIAREGRKRNPDFLVVPQNGERLLEDAAYRSYISAIGKEDILFNQKPGLDINDRCVVTPNKASYIAAVTGCLEHAKRDGIPVLSVEYLCDDAANQMLIPQTSARVRQLGYVPYFSDRMLKRLHPVVAPPQIADTLPVA